MKTPGQTFYEAAFPEGAAWDNLTLTERAAFEKGAATLAPPHEPAWLSALRSTVTTAFGLALIIVSVTLIRPVFDPEDAAGSTVWIGLLFAGATMMGVGGSVFGRSAPTTPRGYSHLGALVLLAAASLIAALLSGCATFQRREVHTQTAPVVVTDDTSGRCITRGYGDGHELLTIIGPVGSLCPEVEVVTLPAPVKP